MIGNVVGWSITIVTEGTQFKVCWALSWTFSCYVATSDFRVKIQFNSVISQWVLQLVWMGHFFEKLSSISPLIISARTILEFRFLPILI